ncbi:dihydrodipicolinate synthase family protein [Psychromarinibacter sp. C21-152]|uniref:Dihydrodipicolinate synthase family protein n=1 Tax=Psychromarinibacter sediminicola TaxID=3033385 RepID=A0AAE3NTS2_9RHOB|nr:dihydrodipicolinate synthase family protein [Psychromarinibacter sediminicola]MDF0601861.1 dihydrodipicolinate synthase family protein [Psychromarinibacter sediminicola]
MRGIVTVLNTPFDAAGAVDLAALERHVRYALAAGVAGFLVPAMAAEVDVLTPAERDGMLRTVVAAAGGRVPVIGGASAGTAAARVANARRVGALGADYLLVSLSGQDRAALAAEIRDVADAAGLPVMVQDWDAAGGGIPVPVLVELFETVEAFRCLKVETADAGPKYTALKAATGGEMHVSGGWAVQQLIEALDRGVDAFMPTALHFSYCGIVRAYLAGDRDGATAAFRALLPVLAFSNQSLPLSIRFFKRLLWRQAIYPTEALRMKAAVPDVYQARIMDELVDLAIALETERGWRG